MQHSQLPKSHQIQSRIRSQQPNEMGGKRRKWQPSKSLRQSRYGESFLYAWVSCFCGKQQFERIYISSFSFLQGCNLQQPPPAADEGWRQFILSESLGLARRGHLAAKTDVSQLIQWKGRIEETSPKTHFSNGVSAIPILGIVQFRKMLFIQHSFANFISELKRCRYHV